MESFNPDATFDCGLVDGAFALWMMSSMLSRWTSMRRTSMGSRPSTWPPRMATSRSRRSWWLLGPSWMLSSLTGSSSTHLLVFLFILSSSPLDVMTLCSYLMPLHMAINKNHTPIAKLLIEKGAALNEKSYVSLISSRDAITALPRPGPAVPPSTTPS